MNKFLFVILMMQVGIFVITLLSKKGDNKGVHYFLLVLITAIAATHIFAFNTDAEDTYISLRYVKNFVEGKGLVFNTFDKVEGYSDFLWVMLIAGFHKIFQSDIPLTARCLSLGAALIVPVYTYYLSYKITREKFLSYLSAFMVSVNGSFACYGLAGLENPLFALFILMIINFTYERKWFLAGLFIALLTMTHPEGFIIYFPIALFIFINENTFSEKCKACFIMAIGALLIAIPWTIWRVSYYGYLIPNSIAAKQGMNIFNQLKLGGAYSGLFIFINSELLLILFLLPVMNFLFYKHKLRELIADRFFVFLLATVLIFILFYIYVGGDWMPGWRFYSSVVPLFSVFLAVVWKNYVFAEKTESLLRSAWIVLLFGYCGYAQIRESFQNPHYIPGVHPWSSELKGLKYIGKWFHNTLPKNTLLATWPNGGFSYYNELPTLDYGGLTDTNVGRFGKKLKSGKIGHIASNIPYILSKKPDIIAIMRGRGFENDIYEYKPTPEFTTLNQFPGYVMGTFAFKNYSTPLGKYVNLNIRFDKKDEILKYLLSDKNATLVKLTDTVADYSHTKF